MFNILFLINLLILSVTAQAVSPQIITAETVLKDLEKSGIKFIPQKDKKHHPLSGSSFIRKNLPSYFMIIMAGKPKEIINYIKKEDGTVEMSSNLFVQLLYYSMDPIRFAEVDKIPFFNPLGQDSLRNKEIEIIYLRPESNKVNNHLDKIGFETQWAISKKDILDSENNPSDKYTGFECRSGNIYKKSIEEWKNILKKSLLNAYRDDPEIQKFLANGELDNWTHHSSQQETRKCIKQAQKMD